MSQDNVLCDIGFIGLGVMGKNLVLNLADNGYSIAAFDLSNEKVSDAVAQDKAESGSEQARVHGCFSYTELLSKLKPPHLIVLSVPAGEPVDQVCESLVGAGIQPDDIVIDTGNSLWVDTVEREQKYKNKFILFSSAVSGGEVGARFGPSLMPSGSPYAWTRVKPIWEAISAKVDEQTGKPIERTKPGQVVNHGEPCAAYIGPAGAGHFVKMVHNGIEYADMQIICEAYHILREGLGLSPNEIADIFEQWNKGPLDSYLTEISVEVLRQQDQETQKPLVDVILDKAGQKGTGLWTAISSLEVGCPAPTIAQAVFARSISSFKENRVASQALLNGPAPYDIAESDKESFIENLHDAIYCAKICAYAQGFQLMKLAAKEHGWTLDFASIAKIWRAGCIIRAVFLQSITDAFTRDPDLDNLMMDEFFVEQLNNNQANWRKAVADVTMMGIPAGAIASSLSYFDSMRLGTLPANLLQGQRDFFGAHTFERVDKPAGEKYHVEWAEPGRPLIKL
ncbi:NADP-dependent phosphogluconate dehydrogenase [Thalassotalea agarivorans]|uniref:6-phosphogluconate dehydrogenase, decarboxylating n=1 Tax=Thalassotalea agarivorans TaxID=349064 RepID=A0A1I0F0A7_THASX|nr:NADP-dependent phosphogluconate dehydrogenase [Thalassotalea agarivorans]SET50642.1 6-phosphogluconate dehydrogenase (decarboxylating) [Thalassotalea agarivorans]